MKKSNMACRPESYFGAWAIIPEQLTNYVAIVKGLDLAALAAAQASKPSISRTFTPSIKADSSPSSPIVTDNPDVPGKPDKDEKKKKLDEKKAAHGKMADDIKEHESKLEEKKKAHSDIEDSQKETLSDDIQKSSKELDDKKKAHKAMGDDIAAEEEALSRDDSIDEDPDEDTEDNQDDKALKAGLATANEVKAAASLPVVADAGTAPDANSFEGYELHNDTAIIYMCGPSTKYPTSFQAVIGGYSTLLTQYAIRQANADPAVSRLALIVDSPGGAVNGTYELMEVIANSAKPLWAYGDDTMASAAYFACSGADYIACGPVANVGSLGTLALMQDTSGSYAADGVKVIPIGTGKYKGAGMDGTPITPEQQAYFQGLVGDTNKRFMASVSANRDFTPEQLNSLSDAGVYIGSDAKDIGLVDDVMSLEAFLAKFETDTSVTNMDNKQLEEKFNAGRMAAISDFQAILTAVDGNHKFAAEQFAKGVSAVDAKLAYGEVLKAELAILKATGVSADAGQDKPLALGKSNTAVENEFMAKVAEIEKANPGIKKVKAISMATAKYPDLYAEYKDTFTQLERLNKNATKQSK